MPSDLQPSENLLQWIPYRAATLGRSHWSTRKHKMHVFTNGRRSMWRLSQGFHRIGRCCSKDGAWRGSEVSVALQRLLKYKRKGAHGVGPGSGSARPVNWYQTSGKNKTLTYPSTIHRQTLHKSNTLSNSLEGISKKYVEWEANSRNELTNAVLYTSQKN